MADAIMPDSLEKHQVDYNSGAWEDYEFFELGFFIHNLTKRSEHRASPEKTEKDLYDAQNYLNIIQSKLDAMRQNVAERKTEYLRREQVNEECKKLSLKVYPNNWQDVR